ncbi:GtrA family protein [Ramlibacter solisilvae]|uniref:Uncharacterized protein n=1 Tax=Ramlibacter tataouinensis TaxID=94132 RepID=A0A127JWR1_9BURK|nr:GtrA family protein [Ramlibacter tataouinensis]AMO24430.1 hypothetical protein UC35_18290 [Ramlibacter tataouinensis]
MTAARIAITYAAIAVIASAVNLAFQFVSTRLYAGLYATALSVAVGTLAGLPVKYMLEKRHIFEFRANSLVHEGETFLVYSILGVGTTLVFWGVEFSFDALFASEAMRYVGGALGLTAGHVMKYQLDKHFVFCRPARVRTGGA